jgi:hypothetical protein
MGARWNLSANAFAGIFRYGGTFGSLEPNGSAVVVNPFTPETKFASVGVAATYRQTRRLSFQVATSGFINRYSYPGALGSTGITGIASAIYSLTARTSLSGSYSRGYFDYQHGSGHADIDGYYGTLSHTFADRWHASITGGVTRSYSLGNISIPVSFIANGLLITGYEVGTYQHTAYTPTFVGSVSHSIRRTDITLTGGQGVMPGNGFYLTSRDVFFGGYASHSFLRRSNTSAGAGFNRFTSVANNVSGAYTSTYIGASFGYNLFRYVSANLHYNYYRYGSFGSLSGVGDNQIYAGISFSSKSVPLTLF